MHHYTLIIQDIYFSWKIHHRTTNTKLPISILFNIYEGKYKLMQCDLRSHQQRASPSVIKFCCA